MIAHFLFYFVAYIADIAGKIKHDLTNWARQWLFSFKRVWMGNND